MGFSTAVQPAGEEHDTILKNMALAEKIAGANMFQQNLVNQQQVLYNLSMVTTAKLVECIVAVDPADPDCAGRIEASLKLAAALRMDSSQKDRETDAFETGKKRFGPVQTQTSPFSEHSA